MLSDSCPLTDFPDQLLFTLGVSVNSVLTVERIAPTVNPGHLHLLGEYDVRSVKFVQALK